MPLSKQEWKDYYAQEQRENVENILKTVQNLEKRITNLERNENKDKETCGCRNNSTVSE